MPTIRHRIGINAPLDDVQRALATTAGVASWWSRDVTGDASEGGKLLFYFGRPEPRAVLEVVAVAADRVEWRCLQGPDEWVGTTMTFALSHADGETAVSFTHDGWREPVPFMGHCSCKWAYFLLGLKAMFEGGAATPFPDDLRISSWG
jgi:uncharacterized protein YndB with AHSA1/START domain